MKILLEKKIENGKYSVSINISNYSVEELTLFKKFGPPEISIVPQFVLVRIGGTLKHSQQLPLHDLNRSFEFSSEDKAAEFADAMSEIITQSVFALKNREDNFSAVKEIEI